jgi:Glycosyl transferases group 1
MRLSTRYCEGELRSATPRSLATSTSLSSRRRLLSSKGLSNACQGVPLVDSIGNNPKRGAAEHPWAYPRSTLPLRPWDPLPHGVSLNRVPKFDSCWGHSVGQRFFAGNVLISDLGQATQFVGHLRLPALQRLYREAGALCLPSYREGLPLAVLEAMAMGTARRRLADGGGTGCRCRWLDRDAGEAGRCRRASIGALLARRRPEWAEALGAAGRATIAKTASAPTIAARWHDLYREVATR